MRVIGSRSADAPAGDGGIIGASLEASPDHLQRDDDEHHEKHLSDGRAAQIGGASRVPATVPSKMPRATGAAMNGWMSPRRK